MSVNEKMTAIADAIRECTGATEKLGLDAMAESIPNVYEAGQQSMVDENKIIPKTVSGTYISVDDVSEIPHSVGCKIERINLFDKSTVTNGKGLSISSGGLYDTSAYCTSDYIRVNQLESYYINWSSYKWACCYDEDYTYIGEAVLDKTREKRVMTTLENTFYIRFTFIVEDLDILQLNRGTEPLPYTPYASLISKNKWKWFDSLSYEGNGVNHVFIDEYNVGWSGKFVFSCDVELSDITYSATGNLIYLSTVLEDGTANYHGIVTDKTTNGKSVFVVDATTSPIYRLGVVVHNRWTGGTINITNIMLNEGGIALPYTPCTPNLARATKSYTHTNNGVTFDAKVNESEFTLNGKITTLSSFTLPIGNVPAGTYTFSFANLQGSDYIFLQGSDNTVLVSMTSGVGKGTFTTTKEESLKMCVCLNPSTDVTYDNTHIYFQLEEGSTATKYVPYKNDYSTVSVTKCGKNLFNTEKFIELVKTYDSTATEEVVDGRRCIRFLNQALIRKSFSEVFSYDINRVYTWSMDCKIDEYVVEGTGNLLIGFIYGDETIESGGALANNEKIPVANRRYTADGYRYTEFKRVNVTSSDILPLSGIAFSYGSHAYWYIDLDSIQIEEGSDVTDVVPYTAAQILTPSADGTVEGMTSLSPYMNIFCDNKDVNIELSYNKSWGMQTEYDRFWDAYQNYGNKTTYNSAFFEWDEKIFYPKYDIKPLTVSAMFQYFNRYGGNLLDLKKRLEECGVVLDCSNSYGVVSYMFYLAYVSVVPELNLAGTGNLNQTFDSSKIETIEKLIVGEKNTFTKTFDNCAELINIVMEGTIASSVSFPHSNKLSKNSIVSILNTLSSTVTGQTLTLNSEAVNTAFETSFGVADGSSSEEWTSLVASKTNWTITLV